MAFIIMYNTTSAVYTRLSINRYMIKHYEALGLLTTPVYVFSLPTHITALLSTGLFITRYYVLINVLYFISYYT